MAAYVALTAAMIFPVAVHPQGIPHDPGDPLLNIWILWWNATAVPFTAQWWNAPSYWPLQGSFTFSEHLAGLSPLTISRIESGLDCRMDTKRKIILALGLTPSDREKVFGKGRKGRG